MVDRNARDRLASALQSFMDERIAAFEFNDTISKAVDSTRDDTVQEIGQALWLHYDDLKDHKIVACKEEWDYFNRLLLLLQSDAEIECARTWRRWWSVRQSIAALSLAGFLGVAIHVGFGAQLFLWAIPFGVLSMLLAGWRRRELTKTTRLELALAPFPSVGNLMRIRRRVPEFSRKRYPIDLQGRVIRNAWEYRFMMAPAAIMWPMWAPIVLLFQALPRRATEIRIE